MSSQPESTAMPKGNSFARTMWSDFGMVIVLIILFIFCAVFVPRFFSPINMRALALAVSMTGMVACTMMLCLASGNFDMSCGAVIACSGVVCAVMINKAFPYVGNYSIYVGLFFALLVGFLVGLANGLIIAYARINALITTLATMQIARGIGYIICDGKAVGISQENFFYLGTGSWFMVPIPVYITVCCFIIFGIILERTSFGRNTLAIGGNEEAANLAGIRVAYHKLRLFIIHGLMSALAGIVLASRMTSGQPTTSQGFELDVISSCVLGGISMSGGLGSIWYAVSGVLIMGIVQNSMNLMNVPTFYQYVARGLILLMAVIFDRYKQRN
ncbi:MAG: L-arabinose ABC transporter permease AraH [Planctomycetota bacterium]|jgi:L-arabinose transport system permease protein|nr:L-arabinose ABC transporter permease AraH [Planctomycetota bacterium]